jgi:hypothetical protein
MGRLYAADRYSRVGAAIRFFVRFRQIVPLQQFIWLVSAMLGAEDFVRLVAGEMG